MSNRDKTMWGVVTMWFLLLFTILLSLLVECTALPAAADLYGHSWHYQGWINEVAEFPAENMCMVHFEDRDYFEQLQGVYGLKLYNRYLYICYCNGAGHWKVEYWKN